MCVWEGGGGRCVARARVCMCVNVVRGVRGGGERERGWGGCECMCVCVYSGDTCLVSNEILK